MKKYLEVYNKEKNYIYPNMQMATPESVALEYAVVNLDLICVIETDESKTMFYTAPVPITIMAQRLGIDTSDYPEMDDLIQAMEDELNKPLPEAEPSAEERIAAAMEFQNLMSYL